MSTSLPQSPVSDEAPAPARRARPATAAESAERALRADKARSGATEAAALPPVLVMNPYYSGLGIARCLYGRSISVLALCSERGVPGTKSRYFDRVLNAPNGRDEPQALCDFLMKTAAGLEGRPIVFPTRDFDVIFLERYREVLAEHFVLPQPEGSPILRVMDKLELASVAGGLGIATPKTVACISAVDVDRRADDMRFPLIVKPRFAYQWRHKGLWEKVGAQKAFITATREELRALYPRLSLASEEVLLQEYVAGEDADIYVLCAYIGRDGEPKGYFTGRKVRQSPPLVGTGCVVEALDRPAVVGPSLSLLKAFGYTGIAEVEFKHHRATDTYHLIEINPRHWDQHELGTVAGINISWLAYADMAGLPVEPTMPCYPSGVRCVWVAEPELAADLARNALAAIAAAPARGRWRHTLATIAAAWREATTLLRGRRIFALSRLDDPWPGAVAALAFARDAIAGLRRRVARKVRRPQRSVDDAGTDRPASQSGPNATTGGPHD